MKPVYFYSIVSFGMAIILCLVLTLGLDWDALLCWLLSITAVTFLTYGYD